MAALFPRFLDDPNEYAKAEEYWSRQWLELICRTGDSAAWRSPWLPNVLADGTPCRDGNPIFSAVCDAERRAIRVIQQAPNSGMKAWTFWLDVFAKGEPEETNQLVISCVLSKETLVDSLALMSRWIRDEPVRVDDFRHAHGE